MLLVMITLAMIVALEVTYIARDYMAERNAAKARKEHFQSLYAFEKSFLK